MPKNRPSQLPRLPIPQLRHTLDRYLASLEPLLLQDQADGRALYNSAYALRAKWADEFENGIGKVLQDRLRALDKASPNNWLNDNFWLYKAYLEWRAPLLINSNWWVSVSDDTLIPESARAGESSDSRGGITFWQIRRAAWMLHRVLGFKEKMESQEPESDTTRTGIWLRENTSKMFNVGRKPQPSCDILSEPANPSIDPSARKVLVMLHNWFYTITVYHPPESSSARPRLLEPCEIASQLRAIMFDAEQRLADGERAVPIGILSADDRDRWSENLAYLLTISPKNREIHHTLLQCLMGLSLEHATYTLPPTSSSDYSTEDATPLNAANRFYDKPFTLIIDPSTRAGATGEHSPCDALVPSIVTEYSVIEGVDVNAFDNMQPADSVTGWERLDWVTDDRISKECKAADERARKIMEDSDTGVLWFKDYGADWIKVVAGFPPDAYIQLCLQLAWYSTRNNFTATYETVLTRMFKHGRTETLRSLTRESRDWVLSMRNLHCSSSTRRDLLQRAITKHTRLTREAATGRGIDRHLLGLHQMLRPLNGEHASLFEDELFTRSTCWALSTSGLSAGHSFQGTGFGATYQDGYGINYLAAPEMIKFGIESKFSSPLTSTPGFMEAIRCSLLEMKDLCSTTVVDNSATSIPSHL
ncbi:acyltransferase ChoActase/COT/CPT [Amanita rubescens]|nr:acyltransferase ChoActase/COT/CPT [Amanita rubescens]